jgi:adenosylhomocysteinase
MRGSFLSKRLGISVFAIRGEGRDSYYHIFKKCWSLDLISLWMMEQDLVSFVHGQKRELLSELKEEQKKYNRCYSVEEFKKNGELGYPVIAVNDALTKHLFDNRYGTGQSSIEAVLRVTHILLAGKKVVVAGYGWCGKGIAARAKGMGAQVAVVEVDPVRALEAALDGNIVLPMKKAASWGEVFITATGNTSVIRGEHFLSLPDGAILANAGHFNVEIDIQEREELSVNKREVAL